MQLTINAPSILICAKPIDFRRQINGLVEIILSNLQADAKNNIFIFYNRTRDKLKILAWHKNGYILLLKRLEKGHFFNAQSDATVTAMTPQQLSWLLAGLDWVSMSEWGELEYEDFH